MLLFADWLFADSDWFLELRLNFASRLAIFAQLMRDAQTRIIGQLEPVGWGGLRPT
jgi:hypothetical protein